MSQPASYYGAHRPSCAPSAGSPSTSGHAPLPTTTTVRPLPTPGFPSPSSPPPATTTSPSPPSAHGFSNRSSAGGYQGESRSLGSAGGGGLNAQSPEPSDDAYRWTSSTAASSTTREPGAGGTRGSGFSSSSQVVDSAYGGSASASGSNGYESSLRGAGGYTRREGSTGTVGSPSSQIIRSHAPLAPVAPYSSPPTSTTPGRSYQSSHSTPQPAPPQRSSSRSPSSSTTPGSHSHSPTASRSPLRHSTASHDPLPSGTLITATADHESLSVVPLSGLSSVEAIKEMIMARLHIADEDMPRHAFYLTRIGGGEGRRVEDDELWDAVEGGQGQVTVFVKDLGRDGESGSARGSRRRDGEDSEEEFGVGMSAERMRQVSSRRERMRQKSGSIGSTSEASVDEFGQPTQRTSPGGAGTGTGTGSSERLRSDRPSWTHHGPASWGHSSRAHSASEGAWAPPAGSRSPGASPPMERSRSGGSAALEYEGTSRVGSVTPTGHGGPQNREDYFLPPHRHTATSPGAITPHGPAFATGSSSQGPHQVVMGPSGPTRRLPPAPSPSLMDPPDHHEMQAHNQQHRQRMQTAPTIQVSSPNWNRAITVPTPSNMPLPPSPQPSMTAQMLTRPPGSGSSPHLAGSRSDPRSALPHYTSQPYKNLPLPNSPYHNLSLQSSYQPVSSTVNITYTQHPSSSSSSLVPVSHDTPYNVQQHERLAAQQRMISKSADNLRGHYSTPASGGGFDPSRPPVPPPIPPHYRPSTATTTTVPQTVSRASNASGSPAGGPLAPPPPPASAFYSSPVQAQHQAQSRAYTTPSAPPSGQAHHSASVARRPPLEHTWSQPRPSTVHDFSTGQLDLRPGEILQSYTDGYASSGGGSRKRSEPTATSDDQSGGRRRESSESGSSFSGADERRSSRDRHHYPSSLQPGGRHSYSSGSSPSPTSHAPLPSAPPFADDDGQYDGLASPDHFRPSSSSRSSASASASAPPTPPGDASPLVSAPTSKSSSQQGGPKLDEFGDPIDEETSTWFPVGQGLPPLASSSQSGHPSPFSPTTHSPLAKASTTVPIPASSPYGAPTSSPMKPQYSSSSSGSAPGAGGSAGSSSTPSSANHERRDSVPTAQDWQQTILSRFGASNLNDASEESTLMASGTLRPYDSGAGPGPIGLGVAKSSPAMPKVVDEFGDEIEDDATFFPGFGPQGSPSTPQGKALRLEGMHPPSPTSGQGSLKRPNLRLTIDGHSGAAQDPRGLVPPAHSGKPSSASQQQQRSSEPSPPSGSRSSRRPHNPRLDELVRLASPPIARRNSFAAREKDEKDWAIRPPVETVLENLDVFFPEHDLDKPVFDLATTSPNPAASSSSSSPVRDAPPLRTNRAGSGGGTGGPLGYRKSIRVVAQDRKRMLQKAGNNVARAVSGLGSNLLRRRSTKLFGARIEEVTSAQMQNINAIKETSDGDPEHFSYKWIKGDLIGRGTYGHVYIALSVTTGETIAVKQVEMPRTYSDKEDQRTKGMISSLKAEIELLKDLDHPNIVLYLGMEQTHEFLSIFLEYVPGGSVGRIIRTHGKFEENIIKFFTLQILDGLEYLHSLGILHRDMKADNILIDQDGMCKISDFGTSKKSGDIYQNNENMSMQGSIFWMAPEVIHNNKQGYSAKADIWSLGCICIEMLAGSRPWEGEGFMGAMFKLGAERMRPPLPDDVERSAYAEEFVSNCLQIEPDARPRASEAKHHPFLIISPGWSFTQTSLYRVMTSDRLPSTPSASSG
ncbi:hypothetical protein JCM10212_006145 [Sporobolomyces blumeae]